jgi:hypothetical protein
MKKSSTARAASNKNFEQKLTIGLDLGDRSSWYCVLDEAGEVVGEQKLGTTPKAMKEVFAAMPRSRVALETGMHSPWVSRLLSELSHEITQTAFSACRAQYPGGLDQVHVLVTSLPSRPSPSHRRVGVHDYTFEACSSFTRVTACKVARPPCVGFVTRLHRSQFPSCNARWLPDLTNICLGGSFPRW